MVASVNLGNVFMISSLTRAIAARGWFVDTGATVHVCGQRHHFRTYRPAASGTGVVCADGHRAEVLGVGNVCLKFKDGCWVTLRDVLHVPAITKGLVAADKFDRVGFKMEIWNGKIEITKGRTYVGKANNCGGMYRLSLEDEGSERRSFRDSSSIDVPNVDCVDVCVENGVNVFGGNGINEISFSGYFVCSISLWHKRLAHTNIKNIEKMKSKGMIKYDTKDFEKCETCVESKLTKKPFPSVKRDTSILELIHSYLCELNGILTRGGKRYFITFCDDFSRYLYVYMLRSKDETFDSFKLYKVEVENQLEKRIKILRSDRGG